MRWPGAHPPWTRTLILPRMALHRSQSLCLLAPLSASTRIHGRWERRLAQCGSSNARAIHSWSETRRAAQYCRLQLPGAEIEALWFGKKNKFPTNLARLEGSHGAPSDDLASTRISVGIASWVQFHHLGRCEQGSITRISQASIRILEHRGVADGNRRPSCQDPHLPWHQRRSSKTSPSSRASCRVTMASLGGSARRFAPQTF